MPALGAGGDGERGGRPGGMPGCYRIRRSRVPGGGGLGGPPPTGGPDGLGAQSPAVQPGSPCRGALSSGIRGRSGGPARAGAVKPRLGGTLDQVGRCWGRTSSRVISRKSSEARAKIGQVGEPLPPMEPKLPEVDPKRVVRKVNAPAARAAVCLPTDADPVKVGVTPAHRRLQDAVPRAEICVAAHQETPPDQSTHAAEHGTKQVNAAQDRTHNGVDTIEVYVA